MRRTCEECKINIAYRWFLGLSMYDDIPNYSTWSQNYERRYKGIEVEIVKKVYEDELLEEINEDRIKHGKKKIDSLTKKEVIFDEATEIKIQNILKRV